MNEDNDFHEAQRQAICQMLAEYETEFESLSGPCRDMVNSIKQRVKVDVARCLTPEAVDYAFARFAMWYVIGWRKSLGEIRMEYEYLETMIKIFDNNCFRAGYNISLRLLNDRKYDLFFDFVEISRGKFDEEVHFEPERHYALTYMSKNTSFDFWADWDSSELVHCFRDPRVFLVQAVGLTLTRIQMIKDLEALPKNKYTVGQLVPQEILTMIQSETALSSFIANDRRLLEAEDHAEIIEGLINQIYGLYCAIDRHYPCFWPCLVYGENPFTSEWFDLFPDATAHMVVQHLGELWLKIPGAIELIAEHCMSESSYSDSGWKIRDQFVPEEIVETDFSRTEDDFFKSEWPQERPLLNESGWSCT